MTSLKKALLLSLLVAVLYSQSGGLDNPAVYTVDGQTYSTIYGSGSADQNNLGTRTTTTAATFSTSNTYIAPAVAPPPAVINCPYNQVYDNIQCKCVCINGFYFDGATCVALSNYSPNCGKN
jgi:hypothetical protein